ncbi:MAG TPA: hypothetical protein VN577_03610 [Terriglobales bacterium]|nr:hypothetical protein [Terriglobales bacterium]
MNILDFAAARKKQLAGLQQIRTEKKMSAINARNDGRVREPAPTSGPMLSFNLQEEIHRLESEQPWQAEHTANTLVKYPDLRIVLVALKAGGALHEHRTSGRISIQALTGKLTLHLRDEILELAAGQLATLDHDLVHDVVAQVDSVFLLTIVWPEGRNRSVESSVTTEAFSHWFATMQPTDRVVPINRARQQRERGLDETLAETFPCSDAMSSLPNPLVSAG